MLVHLHIIGVALILLAGMHVGFPRYFKWKEDLAPLSPINREMMQTHTFFIALVVGMMGLLCLTSGRLLMETELGQRISLGLAVFWAIRLFFQHFVYSSALWRGKTFETTVHVIFTVFWGYLTTVFFLVWWQ